MTANIDRPLLGSLYISLGTAMYVANDTVVKIVSDNLSLGAILSIRGCFAILAVIAIASITGDIKKWRTAFSKPVLARAAFDTVMTFMFLNALFKMSIASATTILQTAPLVVVVFGVTFLREKIGWRRIGAIFLGFIGVLLIIKPGSDQFNLYSLLVVATVFMIAMRDTITRSIPSSTPSLIILFTNVAMVTLAGFIWLVYSGDKVAPSDHSLVMLFITSLFLVAATMLVILASRVASISATAPFRYTAILWSLVSAWAVFGEVPGTLAIVGIVLITIAGLYTLFRTS